MPVSTLRKIGVVGSVTTRSSESTTIKVKHIPNLPQSDVTKALLDRIFQEFYPIIERRGYDVVSISEMCCCGDGLDSSPTNNNGNKRRKRQRIMSANVLGYNQSWGRKHSIHLRMRNARNHAILLPYEDIAGTMAHELAHCEHSKHDAKFYKLMDEIQEQHAVLLARGLVVDKDGFPMNSEKSYVLGGSRATTTSSAAAAAEKRRNRNQWMPTGPQKLGGDSSGFQKWLRPGEAAAIAAEERRLADEKWCLPCQPETVEIFDSSSDDDSDKEQQVPLGNALQLPKKKEAKDAKKSAKSTIKSDKKVPAVRRKVPSKTGHNSVIVVDENVDINQQNQSSLVVDLTLDNNSDEENSSSSCRSAKRAVASRRSIIANDGCWSCGDCTYKNTANSLACAICGKPRLSSAESIKAAKRITIQEIQEAEVRQSEEDFGFNIYGNGRKRSSQMKHIT